MEEPVDGYGKLTTNEVDDILTLIDRLSVRVEFKHGRTALLFALIDEISYHLGEPKE